MHGLEHSVKPPSCFQFALLQSPLAGPVNFSSIAAFSLCPSDFHRNGTIPMREDKVLGSRHPRKRKKKEVKEERWRLHAICPPECPPVQPLDCLLLGVLFV